MFTTPEFLERRFSGTARWVLSLVSVVGYILTKIAVSIFAGGVVFASVLPDLSLQFAGYHFNSFWVGSVAVVVLTGIYTVVGGMRAVAYTEVLQTFVLVGGSLLLTVFGLNKLGGWSQLRATLDPEMFNLWKPLVPHGIEGTWLPVKEATRMAWYFNDNYPWVGMLFCAPIVGLWYWCTDQHIVQRTFMAPNETEARRGTIFGSFLKLSPVFIFIIPRDDRAGARQNRKGARAGVRWSMPRATPSTQWRRAHTRCSYATCCRSDCAARSSPGCWLL